jgi:2-haloacid dehalogenase
LRAAAVIFGGFGTLFEVEPARPFLVSMGLPARELEVWLARTEAAGIALCAAGTFRTFREVATSTLTSSIAELGNRPDLTQVQEVVESLDALPACKDLKHSFLQLTELGTRVALLTNASVDSGRNLLLQAGVLNQVARVFSIDEVRRWKPFPEPYLHAAKVLGLEPRQVAFVSANPWDVTGAHAAGLYAILLQRRGGHPPAALPPPDLTIAGLAELAQVGARFDPV